MSLRAISTDVINETTSTDASLFQGVRFHLHGHYTLLNLFFAQFDVKSCRKFNLSLRLTSQLLLFGSCTSIAACVSTVWVLCSSRHLSISHTAERTVMFSQLKLPYRVVKSSIFSPGGETDICFTSNRRRTQLPQGIQYLK